MVEQDRILRKIHNLMPKLDSSLQLSMFRGRTDAEKKRAGKRAAKQARLLADLLDSLAATR